MGAETIVFGYICLDPNRRESNEGALAHCIFDALYPFTNIFSSIKVGYGGDIVSFAGSFKSLDEDWIEWEQRFEGLITQLYGRTARVNLEHETDGAVKTIEYLCRDGWESAKALSDRHWTKWYCDKNGQARDEVPVRAPQSL